MVEFRVEIFHRFFHRFFHRLFPASVLLFPRPLAFFPMVPLFRIETYRGTATGWQTVGIRPAKTAGDFLILLAKVRPDYAHRLKPVS